MKKSVAIIAFGVTSLVIAGHYDEAGNYHRSGLLDRHNYYNGYYDSNGDYHHFKHKGEYRHRYYDIKNKYHAHPRKEQKQYKGE